MGRVVNRERVLPSHIAHKDVFLQCVVAIDVHAAVFPHRLGASLPDVVSLQCVSSVNCCIASSTNRTFLYSQRITSGTRLSPSNSPISQDSGLWILSLYCSLQRHPKFRQRYRLWMESLFIAVKIPPLAMRRVLVPHQWTISTVLC